MRHYPLTRRQLLQSAAAGIAVTAAGPNAGAAANQAAPGAPGPNAGANTGATVQGAPGPYADSMLPAGVRSRLVDNVNGLRMHVIEAGSKTGARAGVLLLHGFPELAYSWRRLMPALAAAGYHVMAPDLRGYGRTDDTGVGYDDDLRPFRMLNEVRDMLSLVSAFGYREVHLAGHDFGSLVASWCAVARPDVFRSVVLMSAPFGGTATLPFDTADAPAAPTGAPAADIDADLASLDPPRWHYRRFYATRGANEDLWRAPQGVHDFLRAYYHMKSGDWSGNRPEPLREWSAAELGRLPRYYVLDLGRGMAETVAEHMPSAAEIAACEWLPDDELRVYSAELRADRLPGRAAVVPQRGLGVVHLRRRHQRRPAGLRRTHHRPAVDVHRGGRATGASTSARAPSSGWTDRPAPTSGASTCSTGPATGFSRRVPRRSTVWCSTSCARSDDAGP